MEKTIMDTFQDLKNMITRLPPGLYSWSFIMDKGKLGQTKSILHILEDNYQMLIRQLFDSCQVKIEIVENDRIKVSLIQLKSDKKLLPVNKLKSAEDEMECDGKIKHDLLNCFNLTDKLSEIKNFGGNKGAMLSLFFSEIQINDFI